MNYGVTLLKKREKKNDQIQTIRILVHELGHIRR